MGPQDEAASLLGHRPGWPVGEATESVQIPMMTTDVSVSRGAFPDVNHGGKCGSFQSQPPSQGNRMKSPDPEPPAKLSSTSDPLNP